MSISYLLVKNCVIIKNVPVKIWAFVMSPVSSDFPSHFLNHQPRSSSSKEKFPFLVNHWMCLVDIISLLLFRLTVFCFRSCKQVFLFVSLLFSSSLHLDQQTWCDGKRHIGVHYEKIHNHCSSSVINCRPVNNPLQVRFRGCSNNIQS